MGYPFFGGLGVFSIKREGLGITPDHKPQVNSGGDVLPLPEVRTHRKQQLAQCTILFS